MMTLVDLNCLITETVTNMPYPLLMGILGASILALLVCVIVAMKKWTSDLGRYGVLYPYVWAACFIVLLLATLLDRNASVVENDISGWYRYVVILGVSMCFSLVAYCGPFLLLCVLEVMSHHFRWFFFLWIFAFCGITGYFYFIPTVERGGSFLNEFDWSKLKFWGNNPDVCDTIPEDVDFVDMRKCKTPAVYSD